MKTFGQYVLENSGTDVGRSVLGTTALSGDQEEFMADLFKAMRIATANHKEAVMRFLRGLAGSEPEIQQILDKIGSAENLAKASAASRRGLGPRVGSNGFGGDRGDVVVPSVSDTGHGEVP